MTQTPLPPASKSATFPSVFCFLWKIKKIKKQKRIDATFFRLTLARENESNADVFWSFFVLFYCVFVFCRTLSVKDREKSRGFLCGRQWRLSHEISADNQLINRIIN